MESRKQRQRAKTLGKKAARQAARKAAATPKCSRCKAELDNTFFFRSAVCEACLALNPKRTSKEKSDVNLWDDVDLLDRITHLAKSPRTEWSWAYNTSCKYLDIRVDMRDGGCIVHDDKGVRIGIDALNWQYSAETPERPET